MPFSSRYAALLGQFPGGRAVLASLPKHQPTSNKRATSPEMKEKNMDLQEMRGKLVALTEEMRSMVDSTPPEKWTAEDTRKFAGLEREHQAVGDAVDRYQALLDRAARDSQPAGSIDERRDTFGGGSDVRAALGRYAISGDSSGFSPQNGLTEDASSGGVLVPSQLSAEVMAIAKRYSPLRNICKVLLSTTAASKYTLPVIVDGAASGWVSETTARPETTAPKIASVVFPDAEVYANVLLSQWVIEDSRAGEIVVSEVGKAFGRAEGRAFILGDGTNQPVGFLHGTPSSDGDDDRDFGALQYVKSGSASTTTSDALIELMFALKPEYRQNATWVMNSNVISVVRRLKNSEGDYLWADSLAEGQPPRLLGYPVLECGDMPDIAADAFPIAFGDFMSGYVILDRAMGLLRDPFSNKPMVSIYARKRVSGAIVDSCAIKLLKITA